MPDEFDWLQQGSGPDVTGPQFLALRDAVARGVISPPLVHKYTRFPRDRRTLIRFVRVCKSSAVDLHFADGTAFGSADI